MRLRLAKNTFHGAAGVKDGMASAASNKLYAAAPTKLPSNSDMSGTASMRPSIQNVLAGFLFDCENRWGLHV